MTPKNCTHNDGSTQVVVKNGKEKITYKKCNTCGAILVL